ncbi:ABC transporter substrate-binding protein [Lysinibacillus piscis]|uniref:Carbohydrate ABC transporter substrate-binding protein n=1 Tax=Lysinibacillus piscis TaxID=2518931 RepID=A0ABQ5NRC0_9BACI|nr:ABC transporter substrate-binding protein [Lysinibacillus sp. KH24]GLC90559.1 hypothetical protein LYSBPC_36860 [Lysinibacillus sp. KH24]
MKKLFLLYIFVSSLMLSGCINSNKEVLQVLTPFEGDTTEIEMINEQIKHLNIVLETNFLIGEDEFVTLQESEELWSEINKRALKSIDTKNYDLLIGFPTPYLDNLIQEDKLRNITKEILKELDNENFHKPVLDVIKKAGNGEIYFTSPSFNSMLFAINQEHLKAAGVDLPLQPLNWDTVEQMAKQISKKTDFNPISIGPGSADGLFMDFELVTAPMNIPIKDSINSTELYEEQEWADELNRIIDLVQLNKNDYRDESFFNGELSMKIMYPHELNILHRKGNIDQLGFPVKTDLNITILPPPSFKGHDLDIYIHTNNIALTSNTLNTITSLKVLKYLISKEYAIKAISEEKAFFRGNFPSYYDKDTLTLYKTKFPKLDNPKYLYYGEKGSYHPEVFTQEQYVRFHEVNRNIFPLMVNREMNIEQGVKEINIIYKEREGKK